MSGLPLVPFAPLPKINWRANQEIKPRVDREEALLLAGVTPKEDIVFDDIDEEKDDTLAELSDDESVISSVKSDRSEEEIPIYEYIESILPRTPPPKDGSAPTIIVDEKTGTIKPVKAGPAVPERPVWLEPPEPEPEVETCSQFLYRVIEEYKAKQRVKRQHYILKEFEERIKKMDQQVREEIFEEIKIEEKAVMKEAILAAKRRKANAKPKKPRRSKKVVETIHLPDGLDEEIEERDREMARVDFFCNNLHYWRVDALQQEVDHEEQLRLEEGDKAEREAKRIGKERMEKQKQETIKNDEIVFKDDFEITQNVNKLMRQSGVVAGYYTNHNIIIIFIVNYITTIGTNADKKVKPKTIKVNTGDDDELRIRLRDNVDFSGPKRRTANFEHPFDKVIIILIIKIY